MMIDLSIKLSQDMFSNALSGEKISRFGHLGTHFDCMNREFPLENIKRRGIIVDVLHIRDNDIDIHNIACIDIQRSDFIIFYTGFLKEKGYATQEYNKLHPQLSHHLIKALIDKEVSLIGIDAPGIRRGSEHTPADQLCADNNVFVVENLGSLDILLRESRGNPFTVYTMPLNFEGLSGLPCRIAAEV